MSGLFPKGPRAQIGYTLALKQSLYRYFWAQSMCYLGTWTLKVWVESHGPVGTLVLALEGFRFASKTCKPGGTSAQGSETVKLAIGAPQHYNCLRPRPTLLKPVSG